MRLYLLGFPLTKSVSPALQNAALRACGLNDWIYEKLPLPPGSEQDIVDALRSTDVAGANVTIPHKQALIQFLDDLTIPAGEIGAVNTIFKRGEKLIGENTDGPAFIETLREHSFEPCGTNAFIIGAGGAASAVAFSLAQAGARRLELINRSPTRAAGLATRLRAQFPNLELGIGSWSVLQEASIVINASPVGMFPKVDDSPIPKGLKLPRGSVVYDLVYNPTETRLLREAAAAGAKPIGGLEMLVGQGALSFEIWTGRVAPREIMRDAAWRALCLEDA